jgi:protein O-mannosyl-transferase
VRTPGIPSTGRNRYLKQKKGKHIAAKPGARSLDWVRGKAVFVAAGALLIIAFLCYANALQNGFVFDDNGHVLRDKSFRSLSNLPRLLVASYRPLRDISYALDFALWGEGAFGFHLTSVLIHIGNTLLVFALVRRFTREVLPPTLAALIFAIHPVQVDAVAYISGRRDVLFSFFYLVSFHCYLTYRKLVSNGRLQRYSLLRAGLFLGLFLGCWTLSLMSKEMAASLPLLIFVWSFCDVWGAKNRSWVRRFLSAVKQALSRDKWLYIVLLPAVPAYVWYQVFLKGASQRARLSGFDWWGGTFYTNFLTSIRVHAWYLKQLVFPTPIVQYSGAFDVATTLFEWRVIVSISVVGATLIGGFVLLDKDKLMAFAVLSFFVLLLPVSQIIPHHELLADHYLYLPLMSFGLLAALVVRKVAFKGEMIKRVAYGTAAAVVIVFAVMTVLRNAVYKDDLTLWKTNYQEVPNSVRAISSLAGQYATSNPAKGAELYRQCITLDPTYAPAYVSLAVLYQRKDRAREVEELVEQGLALSDSLVVSGGYQNPNRFRSELTTALAISKGFQGFPAESEALLLKAIDLFPMNSQPYGLLAWYYRRTVDREKEIGILTRQLAVFPTDYDSLQSLSFSLIERKRYDEASPYLERILSMVPNDFYANYELGQIHRTKKDCARATRYLRRAEAAAANPEDTKAIKDALIGLEQECPES